MLLRLLLAATAVLSATLPLSAHPKNLMEPTLRLAPSTDDKTRVALTFDACDGKVDNRILDVLRENRIPATIFVTGRWLKHNQAAFAQMLAEPDLFEIENHGARHVPAVDLPVKVFGIAAAGSAAAVADEINGGAAAIAASSGPQPQWFRGATAEYTASSIKLARELGYKVAGFSINGDIGASLMAGQTEKRFAAAKDGDVIIAHINQPSRAAGAGVVKGILDLKARGVTFVRLSSVPSEGSDGTTDGMTPTKVAF